MNNYIRHIQECIDDKFIEYSKAYNTPLTDLNLQYHLNIIKISKIYRIPKEHYSKILAISYNKTMKDIKSKINLIKC